MHTLQIAPEVLEDYKSKLGDERIDFLITQAQEQLKEISQDETTYNGYLEKANITKKVDDLVTWILFMSNEDICFDYIDKFKKDFFDMTPMNDLAELLFHVIYLKNVKNIELDGLNLLLDSTDPEIDEVDQHSFMNVLHYIQRSKQQEMEF